MEPLETARQSLQKLQEVVAFLEDHPRAELHQKKCRKKLSTARTQLRALRQALRDYREANQVRRRQEAFLIRCDDLIAEYLPDLEGLLKHVFCRLVDDLERHFRAARLISPPQLPPFPRLPKGVPNWIPSQLRQDYEEIGKCFRVQANRAALAFAARMIECALGHRYQKRTRQDPVAANWTLGRLVEEAKRRGILDDVLTPGVEDVLNWLNKTRIASVHVKPKVYDPSQQQVRVLIELTLSLVPQLLSP